VEVRPGRGRCVVATQGIPAGSVVLASRATAAMVTDSSRCANCVFASAEHTCTGCRLMRYCGPTCQRAHWRGVHKHECKALPAARAAADAAAAASGGGGDSTYADGVLLARLLAAVDATAAAGAAPAGGVMAATLEDVMFMEAPPAGDGAWAAAAVVAEVAAAMAASLPAPRAAAAGLDARRVAAAFGRNNFSIADDLMTGRGAAVFPLGALLNHSCVPNCSLAYTVDDASGAVVQTIRTLEDVPAGTELCHAFVELGWPSAGRRRHLALHYGFDCTCALCVGPPASAVAERDALLLGPAGGATPAAHIAPASQPGLARMLGATATPLPPLPTLLERCSSGAAPPDAVTSLWQHAAIAAEHAQTNAGVLARIYSALGVPPPPPAPVVLPPVPHSGGGGGAGDDTSEVAMEVQHAEAALVALRRTLSPFHLDAMAAVNVLFARAMLRDDTLTSVAACSALVAWYRAAYADTPAHPMLALQLFTLGDLCGELAAYRGGTPRTCRGEVVIAPTRLARLASLFVTPGDDLAAALLTACPSCCCTLHHCQRTALAARPALYAECGASLAFAYGADAILPAMCRERAAEAVSGLSDFQTYGGSLCSNATCHH